MAKEQDEKSTADHAVLREQSVEEIHKQENQPEDSAKTLAPEEPEHEYVTGIKLWIALAAITLVFFLVLLDMSIIVTVSSGVMVSLWKPSDHGRLSLGSPVTSIPSLTLVGMEARICCRRMYAPLLDVGGAGSDCIISCALQPLTGKFYTHFSSKVRLRPLCMQHVLIYISTLLLPF